MSVQPDKMVSSENLELHWLQGRIFPGVKLGLKVLKLEQRIQNCEIFQNFIVWNL